MKTKTQEHKEFIEKYNVIKKKREKLSSKGYSIWMKANEKIDKLQDDDRKLRIEEEQLVNNF